MPSMSVMVSSAKIDRLFPTQNVFLLMRENACAWTVLLCTVVVACCLPNNSMKTAAWTKLYSYSPGLTSEKIIFLMGFTTMYPLRSSDRIAHIIVKLFWWYEKSRTTCRKYNVMLVRTAVSTCQSTAAVIHCRKITCMIIDVLRSVQQFPAVLYIYSCSQHSLLVDLNGNLLLDLSRSITFGISSFFT